MNALAERIRLLQEELYNISKEAQGGKLQMAIAAERILEIREEIDKIKRGIKKGLRD